MHEESVDWSQPITHTEVKHTMETYSIGAKKPRTLQEPRGICIELLP